jgi:hypothetical protein
MGANRVAEQRFLGIRYANHSRWPGGGARRHSGDLTVARARRCRFMVARRLVIDADSNRLVETSPATVPTESTSRTKPVIADRLDTPSGTLRSRMFDALRALRLTLMERKVQQP